MSLQPSKIQNNLSKKERTALTKAGRFYILSKIHKEGNPGRPIISSNGHPTERISEFVD